MADKVNQLNRFVQGWISYFRYARCRTHLAALDAWIRRKLRVVKLKQLKRRITIQRYLQSRGVPSYQAWILALSGKGWWRMSGCPQAHQAMGCEWFQELGLLSAVNRWQALQTKTARNRLGAE